MMEKTPIIEVQHITKRFKGLTAVKDVSFTIREGGITGMIGPNGAGKSTTFNMICGYYPPTEGKIFFRIQSQDLLQSQILQNIVEEELTTPGNGYLIHLSDGVSLWRTKSYQLFLIIITVKGLC